MIELIIDVNDNGSFHVSLVEVEDGITSSILNGDVDGVTLTDEVIKKADIITE